MLFTSVLITTKDLALEQLLESWFQTSRRGTSSQIKNVAMIPYHPHHISVDKFLENRENLLVTRIDRPMRTVKVSIAGHTTIMSVPLEQTNDVTERSDLSVEMDETIEGVKSAISKLIDVGSDVEPDVERCCSRLGRGTAACGSCPGPLRATAHLERRCC